MPNGNTVDPQAEVALARQAHLLELASDAIVVRDLSGTLSYWNAGAEALYGWTRAEALGQIAHVLLGTAFPQPLATIEAAVLRKGLWAGELVTPAAMAHPCT